MSGKYGIVKFWITSLIKCALTLHIDACYTRRSYLKGDKIGHLKAVRAAIRRYCNTEVLVAFWPLFTCKRGWSADPVAGDSHNGFAVESILRK
jgi:hypothetical protein